MVCRWSTEHESRLLGCALINARRSRRTERSPVPTATPFARFGLTSVLRPAGPPFPPRLSSFIDESPPTRRATATAPAESPVRLVPTALTFPASLRAAGGPPMSSAPRPPTVWPGPRSSSSTLFLFITLSDQVSHLSRPCTVVPSSAVLRVCHFPHPARHTAAETITPHVASGTFKSALDVTDHRELNRVEASSLAAAQWIAYLALFLVCIVLIEIVNRHTFVNGPYPRGPTARGPRRSRRDHASVHPVFVLSAHRAW